MSESWTKYEAIRNRLHVPGRVTPVARVLVILRKQLVQELLVCLLGFAALLAALICL